MTALVGLSRKDGKVRRELARAMTRDVPRGPWYRTRNIGVRARKRLRQPEPGSCVMCHFPLKRNTVSYYQLEDRPDTWSRAIMHYMCAQALQYYLGEGRLNLQRREDD